MGSVDQRRLAAVSAAARRLRVDYAAGEAIRALAAGGVPCILLKGASVARWLFEPEDARVYVDCDLLIPSGGFHPAVQILEELGFQPELDEAAMPSWWREHALTLVREQDGAMIDVHRGIPGVQVTAEQLWKTLEATKETIMLGPVAANVLTEPGRAVHAALHAAQHGGSVRGLEVLARAIDRMDEEAWSAAAELAAALGATAAFRRGLCFLPSGAALAQRLELNSAPVIEVELRAARAPEALTVARLLATRGIRARASFVRRKLVPPPTFMRKWSALAQRGTLGLVLAYAWRPLWVMGRLPRALRAVKRARATDPQR